MLKVDILFPDILITKVREVVGVSLDPLPRENRASLPPSIPVGGANPPPMLTFKGVEFPLLRIAGVSPHLTLAPSPNIATTARMSIDQSQASVDVLPHWIALRRPQKDSYMIGRRLGRT